AVREAVSDCTLVIADQLPQGLIGRPGPEDPELFTIQGDAAAYCAIVRLSDPTGGITRAVHSCILCYRHALRCGRGVSPVLCAAAYCAIVMLYDAAEGHHPYCAQLHTVLSSCSAIRQGVSPVLCTAVYCAIVMLWDPTGGITRTVRSCILCYRHALRSDRGYHPCCAQLHTVLLSCSTTRQRGITRTVHSCILCYRHALRCGRGASLVLCAAAYCAIVMLYDAAGDITRTERNLDPSVIDLLDNSSVVVNGVDTVEGFTNSPIVPTPPLNRPRETKPEMSATSAVCQELLSAWSWLWVINVYGLTGSVTSTGRSLSVKRDLEAGTGLRLL
ncbi:hypothetical protein BaRGS_00022026, partial [Batillaria attramentaria]